MKRDKMKRYEQVYWFAMIVACAALIAFPALGQETQATQTTTPTTTTTTGTAAEGTGEEGNGTRLVEFTGTGGVTGSATLIEGPGGVMVSYDLRGLAPGEHAFHIHERGICDQAVNFESAGDHFNTGSHAHGHLSEGGPHEGDMGNIVAAADGTAKGNMLNQMVTFASTQDRAALNDADGSALVVHATPDDYSSQPSGNAGGRIACAVIAGPTAGAPPATPAAP